MNTRELTMLLATSAVLVIAGCDHEVPEHPAEVAERPAASYTFAGRFQGVESTNQFAVWVVDTHTGAVVRCDTQKCGEWVLPGTPASGSEALADRLSEKAAPHAASEK
jgi:hypothetical protein